MQIAFIGLGVMGYPMAGHLQRKGYPVCVFNRHAEKARHWVAQYGGRLASSPSEAARDASIVFSCVGADEDLRAVCLGEQGAFSAMKTHTVFVDHTTTSAQVAKEMAAAAQARGLYFLDAPISGGQVGAQNGTLTIMVGGETDIYTRVEPVLASYAHKTAHMGSVGNGQLTKMVNQICIAGLIQALAEGLHFAERSGLDGAAVIDVIRKGAAQSWQMEQRYQTMLDDHFDFGFAVDWMRKDLGIALDAAKRVGSVLPITALVDQFYADIQQRGGGRWDTSSLIKRLPRKQPV